MRGFTVLRQLRIHSQAENLLMKGFKRRAKTKQPKKRGIERNGWSQIPLKGI